MLTAKLLQVRLGGARESPGLDQLGGTQQLLTGQRGGGQARSRAGCWEALTPF